MSFNRCETLIAPKTLNEVLPALPVVNPGVSRLVSISVSRNNRMLERMIGMHALVSQQSSGRLSNAFRSGGPENELAGSSEGGYQAVFARPNGRYLRRGSDRGLI